MILIVIISILVSAGLNMSVRSSQLAQWHDHPDTHLFHGAPIFSTVDAPYFLRKTQELVSGEELQNSDTLRAYPNQKNLTRDASYLAALRSQPLLSILLALFTKNTKPFSELYAANYMIIVTAGLTALMVAFCFGVAGFWLEGAVAALGGGLSSAYLIRSSIGRIDTDQLNMGFLYLLFGLAIWSNNQTTKRNFYFSLMLAGLMANVFMWWYGKSELVVLAIAAFVWIAFSKRRKIKEIALGTMLFAGISGINYFNPLVSPHFKEVLGEGKFYFPNTFDTITELQAFDFLQALEYACGSSYLGILCLAGLVLFS